MKNDKLPCGYNKDEMDCIDCCNFETCDLIEHKKPVNCADCSEDWIYCNGCKKIK